MARGLGAYLTPFLQDSVPFPDHVPGSLVLVPTGFGRFLGRVRKASCTSTQTSLFMCAAHPLGIEWLAGRPTPLLAAPHRKGRTGTVAKVLVTRYTPHSRTVWPGKSSHLIFGKLDDVP